MLFKTEQAVKILNINYQPIPFSKMKINYKDGNIERQLSLDPNNFFGFTFHDE
ncbi:hypothetical protein GLGR_2941 [Leminorella grimontii ATCC 33999 = DSM 5078]|nr:hypothetical protein GLGR_2941 [Leminorella grimontii ATCC 33999 = DSM 5078]